MKTKGFTDQQAAKWEATRRGGRRRYIVLYGVIGWGLPTAILWAVLMAAFGPSGSFLLYLAVAIVLFPLGGIWFGSWVWSTSERKYSAWRLAREG